MAQLAQRLLILACSQRKRPNGGMLPALERYDGPAFRVVRRFLRTADSCGSVDIYILSAEFGLIPQDHPIPVYDRRMTAARARELQPSVMSGLREIQNGHTDRDVFVIAGQSYRAALAGWLERQRVVGRVQLAAGTPGRRLTELHDWLYGPRDDA